MSTQKGGHRDISIQTCRRLGTHKIGLGKCLVDHATRKALFEMKMESTESSYEQSRPKNLDSVCDMLKMMRERKGGEATKAAMF